VAIKGTGKVLDGLKTGQLRWSILLMLFFATVINYLDRHVFSVLSPYVLEGLSINKEHYAWVTNAFRAGAWIGLLFVGPYMRQVGARWGFAIAMLFWSIGGAFTGLAWGLVSLMAFRFILGFGESANWPASSMAVSQWFPAKERGIAMGFFNGGVSIGSIFANWFVPALIAITAVIIGGHWDDQTGEMAPSWLWRIPFAVALAVGVPWVLIWLKTYYTPEEHPKISGEELKLIQDDRIKAAPKKDTAVLGKLPFWGLFMARGLTSPLWFFITEWIYLYMNEKYGWGLQEFAAYMWIPFVATDIGNILGGYLSGKCVAYGVNPITSRIWMMSIGAIMMSLGCYLVTITTTAATAVFVVSILIFFWGIWVSNMLAIAADSFPSQEVPSVIGWTGLAQYGGAFIYTFWVGWAAEHIGFTPVFFSAAILPAVGLIFTWTMSTPMRVEKANA
jgi:ACS family hexuronate transporter-like MFS transporter